MGIGGLGNLAFINKAVGLVTPAMIGGGELYELTLRFAVFATGQSVLSQDEDGRHFVVPSGHFLRLPDK